MQRAISSSAPRHRAGAFPWFLGLPLILLVIVAGCSTRDPSDRQAISGLITVEGAAIKDGVIMLEPLAPNGREIAVGATIRHGEFAIEGDRGPTPGAYRVRIYSSSGVQAPPAPGHSERTRRPMVERIPAQYNARSELRMDVVDGGSNRLVLDLHDQSNDRPEGLPPIAPASNTSVKAPPDRGGSPR